MQKLIFLFTASVSLGCASLAAESDEHAVLAVSADEIRQNPQVLEGQRAISTGQPDEAMLKAARAAGFKAVIDLRTASEERGFDEAGAAEALGLAYINLPIADGADITYENAAKLSEIMDAADGPMLLHCVSGNRVGALVALQAAMAGASDEDALAAGKAAGLTRLEPAVVQRLRQE